MSIANAYAQPEAVPRQWREEFEPLSPQLKSWIRHCLYAGCRTSHGVLNGLGGGVDAQGEHLHVGTEAESAAKEHQRHLELTHGVQRLCFLC